MTRSASAVLLLLAWPHLAGAADAVKASPPAAADPAAAAPGAVPPAEAPTPTTPTTPTAPPKAPSTKERFAVELGWGYYEVTHAGLAYHVTERAAFDLFAGGGLAWDAKTLSFGAGFRHHLGGPIRTVQAGWDVKALYWTQSDSDYDWRMFSLVLGGYVVRELDRRLSLKLDAGVALSGALDSTRKQNENFASPQRWNGSVCLELVYRLGS